MKLKHLFLITILSLFPFTMPVFAKGIVTVEKPDGDTDTYPEVQIISTPKTLYIKPADGENMLIINKKDCKQEGEIQVCSKAGVKLNNYGVDEEIQVVQFFLFTNTSKKIQPIGGSGVTLSPNSILLELLTSKGTYLNGMGKIDSTTAPAE